MNTTEDIIGRYVRVNGTRVHYDELGAGVPLVLIHTLYACSLEWTRILPLLAERGFHCVALDLPGNSRSYPPNWAPLRTPREYGDFISAFISTVFGTEKVVLAGTSIGGNLTIDVAVRHGEQLSAAIAMEGAIWTPTVMPLEPFANPASLPCWSEWLERCALESLNPNVDPEVREELRWQHRFTGHRAGMLQANCWTEHDLRDHAGPTSCPLLVLKREYDFYLPSALLDLTKSLIPNCQTRTLSGIGHYPMCEDPPLIADIIASFAGQQHPSVASF